MEGNKITEELVKMGKLPLRNWKEVSVASAKWMGENIV